MADNARLSDVTAASALTGDELIYVVQGGNSRRSTVSSITSPLYAATRTALKAITPVEGKAVDLLEGVPALYGRFGSFTYTDTDLSASVDAGQVSFAFDATTDTLTHATGHGLSLGNAVFRITGIHGMTSNTMYWVIRVSATEIKLATSYANAVAGTAINITGTGSGVALRKAADPAEGVYVIPSGKRLDGSEGAWVRTYVGPKNICWWGGKGDNSTDNAEAHFAAIYFCITGGEDSTIYYPTGEYQFDRSVNGYRASSGIALTFLGDGIDSTYIISNFYGAGSVMWDFIDPDLSSRVATTNFVGLNFGSVSRSGGVNPRYLRVHGWGNSEMREVKFNPSNNTHFSAGGMQNIKMDRVESWYGGKSWLWTATDGLTFDVTALGVLTADSGTPFQATDASSDQWFTYNHTAGRRRYRIASFTSSTEVQLDTSGFRIAADTNKTGWFGHGLVTATAGSNQIAYPVGHAGPFVAADVGRVVLIKRADEGTYDSADYSILRGVIKSVTSDRVFRLGDDDGNDLPVYRTVTDATIATPVFDFYQPTSGGATLTAGSSHVEITKLHMEHFGGLAMFVDNADAWLIQGKIHGETGPDDDFGSTSGLWVNDFGGRFEGILDSTVSTGSERVYVSNTNKTFTFDGFSRNTINEVQIRVESSSEPGGRVNIPSIEMANYYSSTFGWLVDENGPDKTSIGYMSFNDDGSTPVRRPITTNRGDESNEAAIASTISWNGTPPSGASSVRYRWRQVGDLVFFSMRLEYATPGASNSELDITLPADMPVPAVLTGTSSNEMVCPLSGAMSAGFLTDPSISKVFLRDDNAGGYEIRITLNSGTISADFAFVEGHYWTNAA